VQRDSDARQDQERLAASRAETALRRREELYAAASGSFGEISRELLDAVRQDPPSVEVFIDLPPAAGSWTVNLMGAAMLFEGPNFLPKAPSGPAQNLAFDVIATGSVRALLPPKGGLGQHVGYAGRGHSLYYCDAQTAGTYAWFETAFVQSLRPTQRW
jgi:serine/threonine-protein kinase